MLVDFKTEDIPDEALQADICIIGAGAAGITLARDISAAGKSVIILESGGRDYQDEVQALAEGHNSGYPYYDLKEARLRFFGGTTAIWGGRVAQLDAIDFQARDWIAGSGWPFAKNVLAPFYEMAQKTLELPIISDNLGVKSDFLLDNDKIMPLFWQFDEVFDRFTLKKCADLHELPHVKVVLNATVTDIVPDRDGGSITNVCIQNLAGRAARVKARIYILAAGGIENARLLLQSRHDACPHGLGNQNDQVGRYFMEHPHARAARIDTDDPRKILSVLPRFMYRHGQRYGMLFRPGDKFQKDRKILNTAFTIAVRRHPGQKQVLYKSLYNTMRHEFNPNTLGRGLWKLTRKASIAVQMKLGATLQVRKLMRQPEKYGLYTVMRAEQAPNPDSRITLSTETDRLGCPRVDLDWRFSEIDKQSVAVTMDGFDEELQRLGLGKIEKMDWLSEPDKSWEIDPLVSNHPVGGYHHIGTTRMGEDPRSSVVDANCRLHNIENLYVAGSSVFPTGGWANPTLTILALCFRLSEHIKKII